MSPVPVGLLSAVVLVSVLASTAVSDFQNHRVLHNTLLDGDAPPVARCPRNGTFLPWMQGRMRANFSDGTFAYANFTETYGTVLFEPSQTPAMLSMSQPLRGPTDEGAYEWHECLEFTTGHGPNATVLSVHHRCSLIVRDPHRGGYTEHIHGDQRLVPVCPLSIHSRGLVVERVYPISSSDDDS